MKTKLIEVTDATRFNWGKFCVMRFDHEWERPSKIGITSSLLREIGWNARNIVVLDLQTGEGAQFLPGGLARADLNKHRIWVCPMFEPFLAWLYLQDLTDLDALPDLVDLGNVPVDVSGYRRAGPRG